MKKRFAAILGAMVMTLSVFSVLPATAWAASGSVSVSSATVNPGETVNISVSVNCDSSLGAAVVNVTYDPSILQFNGASGALGGSGGGGGVSFAWYASGEGTTSVSSTLSFTAIGSGTSGVSVSGADVVAWDETAVPVGIGNGSVTVASAAPAPTQPAQPDQGGQPAQPTQPADPNQPTTEPESETPEQVNEDLIVETGGETWYIVEELNADYLPDGFEAVSLNYGEGQTPIEVGKALHADVYLFRVADRDQNNGHFLIWDEADNTFSPLVMINGTHAVIPLKDAAGVPEGFTETEIEVNVPANADSASAADEDGETAPAAAADVIQAWKAGNGTDEDFSLVYVVNPDGELGFYRYDAREQTLQRYVRETLEAPQEPETEEETPAPVETEPAEETGLKDKILPIGLGAAAAAFLIATIGLAGANAKKKARIEELEAAAAAAPYYEPPYDDGADGDGPFDDGPINDGPFDDGPFDDGPGGDDYDPDGPFGDEPLEDEFFDDGAASAPGEAVSEAEASAARIRSAGAAAAAETASEAYQGYNGLPETAAPVIDASAPEIPEPKQAPDFNLPENMTGAKGFISELEKMEQRLMKDEDGGFDE